jgi:hypothetical protein
MLYVCDGHCEAACFELVQASLAKGATDAVRAAPRLARLEGLVVRVCGRTAPLGVVALARVTTLAFAKVTMLIAANAPVLARFVWHVGRVDRRTRLAKGAAAAPDVATRRAPHTISQREAAVRVYACAPRLLAVGAVGRVCAPRLAECDTRVRIVVRRAQTERASERAVGASGTSEWSGKEQHESERGHFMLPHAQAEPAGVSGATGCHAEAPESQREPRDAIEGSCQVFLPFQVLSFLNSTSEPKRQSATTAASPNAQLQRDYK